MISLTFNDFFSILVSVIYRRESSLESDKKEKINQLIYDYQHIDGNAKNQVEEIATLPMEKSKNISYQSMKTQTPKLVGENNIIPHQGMDTKPRHNFMNEFLKI